MLDSPENYAKNLLAYCFGDKIEAKLKVYDAAKQYKEIPNKYWAAVMVCLEQYA